MQSITVKDVVQECLEKNACERTNQDVKILREFMLHFNVRLKFIDNFNAEIISYHEKQEHDIVAVYVSEFLKIIWHHYKNI